MVKGFVTLSLEATDEKRFADKLALLRTVGGQMGVFDSCTQFIDALDPMPRTEARKLYDEQWDRTVDVNYALAEGWSLFTCIGSSYGDFQLQKFDEADKFETDEDAWAFVCLKAATDPANHHRRALDLLKRLNPREYLRIVEHCGYQPPMGLFPTLTPEQKAAATAFRGKDF